MDLSPLQLPTVPPSVPSLPPPERLPRRTHVVSAILLVIVASLISLRWYRDTGTRPTDLLQRDLSHRVDINSATRSELMQVPGIGPQMAERIVARREALGRYERVDDLKHVHGIGDGILNRMRPWVTVGAGGDSASEPERLTRRPTAPTSSSTHLIDLNRASLEELETLPNIGPVFAQRIIDERDKRPFTSVDDLRRVPGIGPKRLEAIRPKATVDP